MNVMNRAEKAVGQKIDACESQVETWIWDHRFAMLVFDCEILLNDVIECFDSIEAMGKKFTDWVIENPNVYDLQVDSALKSLSERWLKLAITIKDSVIAVCLQEGYRLDNQNDFVERLRRAELSSKEDFDLYAIQQTPVLDIAKLRLFSTPVSSWSDFE